MTDLPYKPYDFRAAGATDEASNAFRAWTAKASQAFADHWTHVANTEATLSITDIRTQSLDAAMEQVPTTNYCCTFSIGDQETGSIWHVSQQDAAKLAADLLGLPESAELDERPLTEIEQVLLKSFFETFALSIAQGWLGTQTLTCQTQDLSINPKRVRLCRGKDFVTTSTLLVQLPRGGVNVHWISKKQEMADLLDLVVERRHTTTPNSDPKAIVERLPVEIVGLLGTASIPMRRLAKIAVGDVVPLDQRIDHPIVAAVDGQPFFKCWPGKIGDTVGLEISSCLETNTSSN